MTKSTKYSLLARRIRTARIAANLTQLQLGKALGISDRSISSYEKDRCLPTIKTLKQLAKETNRPLGYFTNDTEEQDFIIDNLAKLSNLEKELADLRKILLKEK